MRPHIINKAVLTVTTQRSTMLRGDLRREEIVDTNKSWRVEESVSYSAVNVPEWASFGNTVM
jgi:hypothetical protein